MKQFILSFFTVLIVFNIVNAQKTRECVYFGTVVDSTSQTPLSYATLRIMGNNGILLSGTISDSIGFFCFDKISRIKNATILIDAVGYNQKEIPVHTSKHTQNLGVIQIQRSTINLEEITITGKQTGYKSMVDRFVLIPDSILLKNTMSVLDLAKKSPLLKVDRLSQTISIPGRSNTLVLINGSYSGKNVNLATIPAENIEKIEIISHPSAKYDSEIGGVINIVLKRESTKGGNVFVNLNYFLQNKQNHSSAQIGYTWKKINTYISYSLRLTNMKHTQNTYRSIQDKNDIYEYHIKNVDPSESHRLEHQVKYGIDYFINKKNLINFSGNFILADNSNISKSSVENLVNSNRTFNISTNIDNNYNYKLQNYSLFYRHYFNDEGHELSINTNAYFMKRNKIINNKNLYLYSDSTQRISIWKSLTDYNLKTFRLIADYSYPFSDKLKVELGFNSYLRYIDNSFSVKEINSSFFYDDFRNAFYANINYSIKKWGIQAGLRAENNNVHINSDSISYFNYFLLPNLSAMFSIGNYQKIKINYARKLNYPYSGMLMPFEYYSADSLSKRQGNPNLKPEVTDNIEFNYSYKKNAYSFISVSLYSRLRSDVIRPQYITDGTLTETQLINTAQENNYGIMLQAYSLFFKTFQIGVFNDFFYQSFQDKSYNGFGNKLSLSLDMMLPADLSFGISYTLLGKEYNYQGYNYTYPLLDEIYLDKEIFKGNGELNISIMNAFLPEKELDKTWDDQFYEETHYDFDSFMVMFQFVWSFKSVKAQKTIKKNNLMEQDIGKSL